MKRVEGIKCHKVKTKVVNIFSCFCFRSSTSRYIPRVGVAGGGQRHQELLRERWESQLIGSIRCVRMWLNSLFVLQVTTRWSTRRATTTSTLWPACWSSTSEVWRTRCFQRNALMTSSPASVSDTVCLQRICPLIEWRPFGVCAICEICS